ncbi:MAG: acetolactate synthase [Clostridium sp.]|nr:acetolactate synthase [Clostridium sp.]
MLVKQISIFLENKSGRLAEVTKVLEDNRIDIGALSLADTTDFGILRLIVNDPDGAKRILKDNDFTVSCTDVIAVAVPDRPGGLARALEILNKESVEIEYMYAFVGRAEDVALVILRVENPADAADKLLRNGVRVLPSQQVYKL